jgi:hypothetical protein
MGGKISNVIGDPVLSEAYKKFLNPTFSSEPILLSASATAMGEDRKIPLTIKMRTKEEEPLEFTNYYPDDYPSHFDILHIIFSGPVREITIKLRYTHFVKTIIDTTGCNGLKKL